MDLVTTIVIGIVTSLILSAIGYCIVKVKLIVKQYKSIENGVQALLRAEIMYMFNDYSAKKFMPIYARENVESLFKEYMALGGNGTVKGLVEQLMRLPVNNPSQ